METQLQSGPVDLLSKKAQLIDRVCEWSLQQSLILMKYTAIEEKALQFNMNKFPAETFSVRAFLCRERDAFIAGLDSQRKNESTQC